MSEGYISKLALYKVSILALLMTLTACGGSSGGGAAPPPPPPPVNTATLPITVDNAQDITESVLGAVTSSADLIDIADVIGLPIVGSANQDFAKPALRDVITQVIACDTGDMTTTWNDVDNDLQLSTGDSFDTQFAMCFFQDSGVTIDGTSTVQNVVVTGDPANQVVPWSLVATFGFIDLTATDAIDTVTINGDLDLEMSSDDNVVINVSLGSALLEVDANGVVESLSDYLMTQVINRNLQVDLIGADGVYTSDILQGSVTFETLEDFMVIGDDNPSSGQLLISDSSSSVLVTVLDNLNVELGIDLDLDGTIDQTLVVTWAEFDIG
jgi:hypothetical protein